MPVPVTNFNAFKARVFIKGKFSTYKAFAKAAGLSENTVLNVCRGTSFPSEKTGKKMAIALGLSYSELLSVPRAEKVEPSQLVFSEKVEPSPLVFSDPIDHTRDFLKGIATLAESRSFEVLIKYQLDQSTPKMILDFVSYGVNQFGLVPKELKITERECDKND